MGQIVGTTTTNEEHSKNVTKQAISKSAVAAADDDDDNTSVDVVVQKSRERKKSRLCLSFFAPAPPPPPPSPPKIEEETDPLVAALDNLYEICCEGATEDVRFQVHTNVDKFPELLSSVHERHGCTLLMGAAREGHTEVVNVLLRYRADPNQRVKRSEGLAYSDALREAISVSGREPIVSALIEARAKVDDDVFAVFRAVNNGDCAVVERLVDAGAQVNACSKRGDTPLMLAAKRVNIEMVATLINCKANIDVKNDGGYNVLMMASRTGQANVVNALIVGKADLCVTNELGMTALNMAKLGHHEDVVQLIMDACGRHTPPKTNPTNVAARDTLVVKDVIARIVVQYELPVSVGDVIQTYCEG